MLTKLVISIYVYFDAFLILGGELDTYVGFCGVFGLVETWVEIVEL